MNKTLHCHFTACKAPVVYRVEQHFGKGLTVCACEAHRPGVKAGAPSGRAYKSKFYTVTPLKTLGRAFPASALRAFNNRHED